MKIKPITNQELLFKEFMAYGGLKSILMFDLENHKELEKAVQMIYNAGFQDGKGSK